MPSCKFQYTEVPERAAKLIEGSLPDEELITDRIAKFADVTPRVPDAEGATEILDSVTFTHHFVDVDGDAEFVRFHWAECGEGEPIVFLHGMPDSWFQWHHQMAALSEEHRCIGIDLKGYGQSEKAPGDYRHEAAAEQLFLALNAMGVNRFTLVTHDRGTMQGDYIAANHPDQVVRYGRGEQHLYHFHPILAPQGPMFAEAPRTGMMDDPRRFVTWLHTWVSSIPIPDHEMRRVIQEFFYEDCHRAAPRYYNCATFRQEWIERRERLLDAWTCPVMIIQGYDSRTQPREFYENAREYIPNARDVRVRYVHAGHYWSLEAPHDVTSLLRELLEM
jgi:pimeloyl-ACP methyl ester carboxylesterase